MRNQVVVHRVVKNIKRKDQYIEPHSHQFFHYIYLLYGHTRVIVDGQSYETQQGSLILVPPNTLHSIISLDKSCCVDLKFSCSSALSARIIHLPHYYNVIDARLSSLIYNIFEEAAGQEQDYDEMIHIRLYELLLLLLRQQSKKTEGCLFVSYPLNIPENRSIRRALQIVDEEIGRPLRVSEVAERCGYSENHFRQAFRRSVGISPNIYINQRKISKSKELMLYSEANVTQIAEKLGYQSIHYFSRLFKKMTGITPTAYISRIRDNRPINVVHNSNTPRGEFEIPVRDLAPGKGVTEK